MEDRKYEQLRSFMALSIIFCILTPLTSMLLLFWSNTESAALIIIVCFLVFFSSVVLFFRFRYLLKNQHFITRKSVCRELFFQIALLAILILWFIIVRSDFIGSRAVLALQKYVAPFLIFANAALTGLTFSTFRRLSYYFQIETIKKYPSGKLATKKDKLFNAENASPVERAAHFNKGLAIELYAVIFLLFLSGLTVYGVIFSLSYLAYFIIMNHKRIFATDFSAKKKYILYGLEVFLMAVMLVFSVLCSRESIFAAIFRLAALDEVTYNLNFIPLYAALLLSIFSMVLRSKLKKHFAIKISKDNFLKNLS